MNRFLKLTVLYAVAFGFTALANQSFAKGLVNAKPAQTHKHRINTYPHESNPDQDPNYGSPTGPGYGGPGPVGSPPKGNPVKPHPRPIVGVPPIGVLTGAAKTL
jgi:hypothetical protein